MWAFMKAMRFDSLSTDFIKFETPGIGFGQPQAFIPVFKEKSDAMEFAGEDSHLVVEVKVLGG